MASQGALLNAKFCPSAVTAIRAAAAREGISVSSLIRTCVYDGLIALGIDPNNPPPIPERRSAIVRRAPVVRPRASIVPPLAVTSPSTNSGQATSPLPLPSAHVASGPEATSPAPMTALNITENDHE